MSIQTFDGLMKQASADIPELTGEDLEAFKKSHRGMTPREYSIQYLKYTIVYSYRNFGVYAEIFKSQFTSLFVVNNIPRFQPCGNNRIVFKFFAF